MNLSEIFGFNRPTSISEELPDIFPISITQSDFVKTDISAIFAKILTDVLERTHGLTDEQVALMWDSCVKSSSSDGLITMLSKAMAEKHELFLVYEKGINVIRKATNDEMVKIRSDYDRLAKSEAGIYISFKNLTRSDMIKFYIGLEYLTVSSLHKSMNLSKAVQIKVSDLRASVSLTDQSIAKAQAQDIARSLGKGRDVLLDAKDVIETSVPKLEAVKESISFIIKKLSFYLGLPESYLIGEQTGGLGTTGENDMRAVERGLKSYYFSVMKPVLETLFGIKVTYKSQDFRQIAASMDVIKTFALVDDTLVSADDKKLIVNRMLDLDEDVNLDDTV